MEVTNGCIETERDSYPHNNDYSAGPCTVTFGFVAREILSPAVVRDRLKVTYDRPRARVDVLRQRDAMQASHLDVRQEGSQFGNTNAFRSQIFQGNFHGLSISQFYQSIQRKRANAGA